MKNAVQRLEMPGAVKFVFHMLPADSADIQTILEVYPQTDKYNTAALFLVSLVRYVVNEEDGLEMIDALKGPQPLSTMEKMFLKDRFSDKKYLPRVYFEGAEPKNNYLPAIPWTLTVYEDPVAPPQGYSYVNVKAPGEETPRRIVMRKKGDEHILWEYNGVLLSVHLPQEEDPWL